VSHPPFAHAGAMVGGGAIGVAIEAAPIVEKKMALTLLLVMVVVVHVVAVVQAYKKKKK